MTGARAIDLALACARSLFYLTPAEAKILRAAVNESDLRCIARARGVNASTVYTQAHSIRRKMGAPTLAACALSVLLDALAILEDAPL